MLKHEREDHARFELVHDPRAKSGKTIKVTTPSKVVRIDTKEELIAQLKHYSVPVLQQVVPNSKFARRNYVEYLRPALRYYCKRFGVEVPGWLKDESYYKGMPDSEKLELFGTTKLNVREFTKIRMPNAATAQ